MAESEVKMTFNGGPAFPASYTFNGMTLRDYFAAAALQGLFIGRINKDAYTADAAEWARHAYAFADAMLKARDR